MLGFLSGIPDKLAWAARQAYIALGFGLAAAAETRVATCPMEGFDPIKVASTLSLPSNLVPVVMLAIGQASPHSIETPRWRFPRH
jgi:nitroreductase